MGAQRRRRRGLYHVWCKDSATCTISLHGAAGCGDVATEAWDITSVSCTDLGTFARPLAIFGGHVVSLRSGLARAPLGVDAPYRLEFAEGCHWHLGKAREEAAQLQQPAKK